MNAVAADFCGALCAAASAGWQVSGIGEREGVVAVTIHDVVRRAKVSVTTVSRALGEPRLIREATLERLLAAAKHLSFRPNLATHDLISGRTGNQPR